MDRPLLTPGLVTGIGSLPHHGVDEAVAFALATTPELPALPSLPQRDPAEGIIEHALAGGVLDGERALLAAHPEGPVKAQLTGPVTLTVALGDDDRALEVFYRNATALEQLLDGRPALCMIDEPSFAARGSLHASGLLRQALDAVEHFAVTGVHCCGPVDWRAVVGAGPLVLSLPVELGGTLSFSATKRHLHAGGWFAWGAVPTDRPVAPGEIDDLWRALDAQLFADARLAARSIVTPACGLANHTVEDAELVFRLAHELGARIAAK